MMAFVGLILNMGTVQLPEVKDYWSTHQIILASSGNVLVYTSVMK